MHKFDLEERTTEFAKRVVRLCRSLPKDSINNRLSGQAVGSAGSVGANYREANDSLGKKDFLHRMRISRKEAKETIYWLDLIEEANPEFKERMKELKQEAQELKNILSTIIKNTEEKNKKI
ncbi:four helix bundle protein [Patescibacteria group bacterium]|nr:four helix bundle protein [Patescibacteria group bacterium]